MGECGPGDNGRSVATLLSLYLGPVRVIIRR